MPVLFSIVLFAALGAGFIFVNLSVGRFVRPSAPNPEKGAAYECGEPTIGPTRVQFDIRFYIIALVYLVFDVEVALFYPWAVVYGNAADVARRAGSTLFEIRSAAVVDMLVFFTLLMVGFAYLWRFGYLDWVRTHTDPKPEIQNFKSQI